MPIKSESAKPPPRIGKIGPYTVFVTPESPKPPPRIGKIGPYTVFVTPESPSRTDPIPVPKPIQLPSPSPVMAPPAQFCQKESSPFAFFWYALAAIHNAHLRLDEHVAHWFGLNQSKYQWALDDYHDSSGKVKPGKLQNV